MSKRLKGQSWPRAYGIFDTKEPGWLGDDSGPLLFAKRYIALAAHTLHAIRLGVDGHRFAVKRFRRKDSVALRFNPAYTPVMDGHDALLVAEGEMAEGRARRKYKESA